MLWLDIKYANQISFTLQRFKVTRQNPYTATFRCPLCGDSLKNKTKTRGYLLQKGTTVMFYCHNCHASMPFGKFLSTFDPETYKQYLAERFSETAAANTQPAPPPVMPPKPAYISRGPLKHLRKISQLEWDHPAKQYVVKRCIPNPYHAKLFYAPRFMEWVNTLIPGKFPNITQDEPRLIIPFIDKEGNITGFQGRAFGDSKIRYITIILDNTKPKVFNYDTVDMSKKVYILEGPIDAMFLTNTLAMAGSDMAADTKALNIIPANTVMVYDNEPRNEQIVAKMEKAIQSGYNICLWPPDLQWKDVNDMIVKGKMKPYEVKQIIDTNTHAGLTAELLLNKWKRC